VNTICQSAVATPHHINLLYHYPRHHHQDHHYDDNDDNEEDDEARAHRDSGAHSTSTNNALGGNLTKSMWV
jgi:hypothetical protein